MGGTRSAIVFGGSSGIGRASAEALAHRGMAVVIASPDEAAGSDVVASIEATGGVASWILTDITSEDAVAQAIAVADGEIGMLHTVVTSAGASVAGEDAWNRSIDLFLKGPYQVSLHALPVLERNGGGVIIHVGSIASIRGSLMGGIDRSGYPTAKHGLLGMTKTLALGYGAKNIRVNVVCPGYIKTALTEHLHQGPDSSTFINETMRVPLGRWGEPEEIGKVVGFLASDDASYISGQAIVIDGGLTAR